MRPITLITLILLLFAPAAALQPSTTFLTDGRIVNETVIDINKMRVDFERNYQVKTQFVWMINFHNSNWNFPNERKQLRGHTCTIILTNGNVIYQNITDYEARRSGRLILENNTYVHVSQVKRIYFPHRGIPQYYANLINQQQQEEVQSLKCTIYPRKGKTFTSEIQGYDGNRRAFTFSNHYISVITNIRMMRFAPDKQIHYQKRYKIIATQETVVLKNGEILTGTFVNFDSRNQTFEFEEFSPIHVSEITKIYFRSAFSPTRRIRRR